MPIAPYLRPDLDQTAEQLPLYITGTLPNAKPGMAYEGRLQIHNQIGACSIVSVTGSDVPPGGSWYVDGDELVLQWPEYAEEAAPIGNPGFESGMTGWTAGAGWTVTATNPIDGAKSGVYLNTSGESVLSSNSRYPVNGAAFSAHCRVRQGASSKGNAGGCVRVEFRNADGVVVGTKDGNRVMSASNNAVKPSDVSINPADYPAGAMTVNIAGLGIRKRQNREVWIDTFSWDYKVAASGININTTLCFTVTIRDSAGRTAQWSECVTVVASAHKLYAFTTTGPNTNMHSLLWGATSWTYHGIVTPAGTTGAISLGMGISHRGSGVISLDDTATWANISSGGVTHNGAPGVLLPSGTILLQTTDGRYSILRSTDGGVTFTPVPRNHANFAGGNYALMLDKNGIPLRPQVLGIAQSLDDGLTWSWRFNSTLSPPVSTVTTGFTYGRDGDVLAFAARSSPGGPEIAVSADNGLSWGYITIPGSGGVTHVAKCLEGPWVAVCQNGIWWADDPNDTWTAATVPPAWVALVGGPANAVAPFGDGFVATKSDITADAMIYTTDGKTWATLTSWPGSLGTLNGLMAVEL